MELVTSQETVGEHLQCPYPQSISARRVLRIYRSMDLLLRLLEVRRAAEMADLREDPLLLPQHEARRPRDVPAHRVRQHGREQRRLARREACRRLVIEAAGGCLDAVDTAAELGDVEIDLEDALLRPQGL